MAKLKAYTVTSGISPADIEKEVLERLKVTEQIEKDDALALTFDYFTKKLYIILSEQMVEKDTKIDQCMLEIKADTTEQDKAIERINLILESLVKSDGGILSGGINVNYQALVKALEEKDKRITELEREIDRLKGSEIVDGVLSNVYYGVFSEEIDQITDIKIKALSTKSQTNRYLDYKNLNLANQRVLYAYPKEFKNVSKIIDQNGIDYTDSFTLKELQIDNKDYLVYVLTDNVTIQNSTLMFL